MKLKVEKDKFVPQAGIPDGEVLPAVVEKIEKRTSPFKDKDGNEQEEVSFVFKVTEGEYAGRTLYGNARAEFTSSPFCRLRIWIQSLMNVDELPVDAEVETEHLIGLPCRIAVAAKDREAPDGSTIVRNYVTDVLPDAGPDSSPF